MKQKHSLSNEQITPQKSLLPKITPFTLELATKLTLLIFLSKTIRNILVFACHLANTPITPILHRQSIDYAPKNMIPDGKMICYRGRYLPTIQKKL